MGMNRGAILIQASQESVGEPAATAVTKALNTSDNDKATIESGL
jgi:hypothetical protein